MLHKISKNKNPDDFWRWKLTLKIRFWHFLMAIFGHLTSLMKKSNPFLWSVKSYLQSEMFLSNSVDMMKNLLMYYEFSHSQEFPKIIIWKSKNRNPPSDKISTPLHFAIQWMYDSRIEIWLVIHMFKGRLSYHLCVECFSQPSFDSEVYTKSATAATFLNPMRVVKNIRR